MRMGTPTRDGERDSVLLTHLPVRAASARKVAELYHLPSPAPVARPRPPRPLLVTDGATVQLKDGELLPPNTWDGSAAPVRLTLPTRSMRHFRA